MRNREQGESASLQELYQRLSRQYVEISTLGKIDELLGELKNNPFVTEWEAPTKNKVRTSFYGNQDECAFLLRTLINAKIPITRVPLQSRRLESIFLKIGHKQAS